MSDFWFDFLRLAINFVFFFVFWILFSYYYPLDLIFGLRFYSFMHEHKLFMGLILVIVLIEGHWRFFKNLVCGRYSA
jgi:hypothetical protein